jgi:SM-20-related protein
MKSAARDVPQPVQVARTLKLALFEVSATCPGCGTFAEEAKSERMRENFSDLCEGLADRSWATATDFLPADAVEALAEESRQLLRAGRFTQAGIGRAGSHQISADTRGDQILWLDENNTTPAQSRYWLEIEALREALNQELFLGLVSFEAHYAFYPPGSFYRKHFDRFRDSDERIISCSLYLNSEWSEADGGQIRLYLDDRQVEIFPRAGTFVMFRSDSVPHEVAAAVKERFSLTGWFRRRSRQPFPGMAL